MSKENGGHGGVVLNMGSVTSFAAIFDPLYVASKHGVKGYSLALAECDPSFSGADDIRIAVMCPTGVDTPFLKASPETLKTSLNLIPMSRVLDACIMAVEDETKHACCIRITHAYGIDLLPMKTPKEWETELKIWKS
ncbi:15-hydroxyprostaglandin dehydrogenase [NAD(+)]-like [Apostichopus japonicus]|uniref:15-hydroxyprostaglandin dehydrogenase [NAD(+)]-like n=1 Tax=Stichopus japonicus TaxID=307972 RepID=UPI003AB5FDAA